MISKNYRYEREAELNRRIAENKPGPRDTLCVAAVKKCIIKSAKRQLAGKPHHK
jgi:hypothetical protein